MTSLIKLTPLEPYFFGGERTFHYAGVNETGNSYFIRSLDWPTQTTLFGTLRYLGNRKKGNGTGGFQRDDEAIGPDSFNLGVHGQSFGWIESISPLYLVNDSNEWLVPVPFDHRADELNYSPCGWSKNPTQVTDGSGTRYRVLPEGLNPKSGLAEGWLNLTSRVVEKTEPESSTAAQTEPLARSIVRFEHSSQRASAGPAPDPDDPDKLLRRRLLKELRKGLSFAFFAELDNRFTPEPSIAYLGQGRRGFAVKVIEEREATEALAASSTLVADAVLGAERDIPPGHVLGYALSDVYLDPARLAECCSFTITKTRPLRGFSTQYGEGSQSQRFRRGQQLLHLMSAGTVFLINNPQAFHKLLATERSAKIAGFNHVVVKEGPET
ncbi:MAG: hypothetical protein LBJ02_01370 [Bifidobacteriaceae bacterium]|jgi:CRISPR-associated protein Cmr3|nr:hypothetical protein [Bifidobacteriaceae bacterium]